MADRVCWVLRWREDGGLYYCELGNGDGRFGGPRSRRRARRFDTRAEARKFRNMHWSSEEVAIVRRKTIDRLILTGGDVDGLVWNVREWRKRGDGWRAEVLAKIGGVSPLAMRILAALARHESEVCDG